MRVNKLNEKCPRCGRYKANILCNYCGQIICEYCYNIEEGRCIHCNRRPLSFLAKIDAHLTVPGLTLIGIGLIFLTLSVLSDTLMGDGLIIIFPFIIRGVSDWTVIIVYLAFSSIFVLYLLMPWFSPYRDYRLSVRSNRYFKNSDLDTKSEKLEYMITTRISGYLQRTIYIETENSQIVMRSHKDKSFYKSYKLPEDFELDDIYYEYDEDYLLLKLSLMRLDE
jgi:hypothetical protein